MAVRLQELRDAKYIETVNMLELHGECFMSMCTGFGKSVVTKRYAEDHPGKSILYITDRSDASIKMEKYLKEFNTQSASKTYNWAAQNKKIDVNLKEALKYDLLVFDEAHLTGAHNCDKFIAQAKRNGQSRLGGSATPTRPCGMNVANALFGGREVSYSMRNAIEDGFMLEPYVETAVYLGVRLKELRNIASKRSDGKWAVSQLNNIERSIAVRQGITGAILRAVEVAGRGIWIVFHPNIAALNEVRGEIDKVFIDNFKNVKTYAVTSDEQHMNVREFLDEHSGFSVVHSVDMLNTGWHFPDIAGLILNRMSGSPIVSTQQLGRGNELGLMRRTAIVDIVGQLSAQKNQFIEEILGMGGGTGGKTKPPADLYDVETREQEIKFDKVLDAIDLWCQGTDYRMTPEEAVYAIRKFKQTLRTAYKASGIPEEILQVMVEAEEL